VTRLHAQHDVQYSLQLQNAPPDYPASGHAFRKSLGRQTEMAEPLRILVIEQRPNGAGGLAELLLPIEELDFVWEIAANAQELFRSASAFAPHVVLCSDYASAHAARSLLDSVRALCPTPPTILIASVADSQTSSSQPIASQFLRTLRGEGEVRACPTGLAPAFDRESADVLRGCFASLLEASASPIVLADVEGWITYANRSACRVLADGYEAPLGTLLPTNEIAPRKRHWSDRLETGGESAGASSTPRLVRFDAISGAPTHLHINTALFGTTPADQGSSNSTVMFVTMSPGSSRIADELADYPLGPGAGVAAGEPRGARMPHGCCLRVTPHDFLFALPPPCSPVEAAFMAQRMLERIADSYEAPAVDLPSAGRRSRSIEIDLADALRARAIGLQYQPQFNLRTGRGSGVEALARWTRSTGECVPPSKFIPIAERSGLILDLGVSVLKSACEALAGWCARTPLTTLSVNVSALQIGDEFCSALRDIVRQFAFREGQLELEITESAFTLDADRAIECLKEWRRLGVRVAVDDFGSGHSSLDYLSHLPVDRLKLDPSLIRLMHSDPKSAAIVRTILAAGSTLGIDVIAEGVETEDQLRMLTQLGCPGAQGYLLGRPMSAAQAQVVLTKPWGNLARRPRAASTVSSRTNHVH
jgi:EAL domain-containing protein (putative c-di-GMP-specific phosphodiesterase class I)/PAS domain-containing protein